MVNKELGSHIKLARVVNFSHMVFTEPLNELARFTEPKTLDGFLILWWMEVLSAYWF